MTTSPVEKLHKWAVEEMKYGGAWDSSAMERISRGPMAGVWAYIATHCKSQKTVQHMTGNLTLARHRLATGGDMSLSSTLQADKMGETERDALLQEKVDLVRKLHNTLAKIKQVKSVIGQHQKDRAALDETMEEASAAVSRHEKAASLLALYMRQVTATVKRLKDVKEKLVEAHNRVNNLKMNAKQDKVFSSSSGVETGDEKAVRQAVQAIVLHMKRIISEPSMAGKVERGEVKAKVKELLGNMSGECLEKALLQQAVNQVYDVKRAYLELDLSAEARKLQLQSQENDNYFLRSVRQEVASFYKKHVESHVSGVNHQVTASKVEGDLARVKEGVRSRLGEEGEAVMKELEAEEAAVRQAAVVSSYRVQMDKVRAAITGMEEEAEETQQLIEKVNRQAFAIEDVKDTIEGLILINSTVYPRLAEIQVANINVLNVEMQQLGKELGTLLKQLMDKPNMQLKQLNSVPLELLASTRINDRLGEQLVPTVQLGILRKKSGLPQLEEGGQHNMENTVQDIVQLKSLVGRLKRDVDAIKKKRDSSTVSHSPDTAEKLAVLLAKHEKGQEDVVLPLLTDALERTASALEEGGRVEVDRQEWRDQAGQAAVDGEKVVEGRTLDQWRDELRVAVARWARHQEGRGGAPGAL